MVFNFEDGSTQTRYKIPSIPLSFIISLKDRLSFTQFLRDSVQGDDKTNKQMKKWDRYKLKKTFHDYDHGSAMK